MDPAYHYDEVHSISDLHFGGNPGFQVFDLGTTLAKFIDRLRGRPKDKQVALVINGDLVDFIAESPPMYFDPQGAVRKMERIFEDPAFKPVWQALRRFTRTPDRHLVITLGNHDLELILPWVRERLLEELSGGNLTARGRVHLSLDGNGFLCGVGGRRVLFVHGNEVDTWNVCDYERIRRIGRDLVQGKMVEEWTPNAGTKMVIDVMNSIKAKYPFIDLLKPETEAAVPVLLAIDPGQARKISKALKVAARRSWDAVRRATGFLSADGEPESSGEASDAELDRIVRHNFPVSGSSLLDSEDTDEILDRIEDRMERGEDPYAVLDRDRDEEYLSFSGALWKALRGAKKEEVVREAFQGLKQDESFRLDHKDSTYKDLDELISPSIDYLVTGHTHLARKISRDHGGGTYFNSGTWIRLMQLTDEILDDADEFARVFKLLKKSTMADLDAFTYGPDKRPLVMRRPGVVSIWKQGREVRAELQRVDLKTGKPGPWPEDEDAAPSAGGGAR